MNTPQLVALFCAVLITSACRDSTESDAAAASRLSASNGGASSISQHSIAVEEGVPFRSQSISDARGGRTEIFVGGGLLEVREDELWIGERSYGRLGPVARIVIRKDGVYVNDELRGQPGAEASNGYVLDGGP